MVSTQYNSIIDLIGMILTIIFACEAVLKIFAMGFVLHQDAYLRDGWNVMDFIIVITGILDLVATSFNLKSLRTLRALRPLRSINAIPSMRKLVSALINSLPDLLNVSVFLFFIIILFAILGLQQFSGCLYYKCRLTPQPVNSTYWPKSPIYTKVCSPNNSSGEFKCPNNLTCGNPVDVGISLHDDGVQNDPVIQFGINTFDNFGQAVLAVIQIITRDGWWNIMYNLKDGTPPAFAKLFCTMIIILVTYFLFNLILAVIMQAFTKIQDSELEKEIEKQREKEFEIEQKKLIEEEIAEVQRQHEENMEIEKELKEMKRLSERGMSYDGVNLDINMNNKNQFNHKEEELKIEDKSLLNFQNQMNQQHHHKYNSQDKKHLFQQRSIITEFVESPQIRFGKLGSKDSNEVVIENQSKENNANKQASNVGSPQKSDENYLHLPSQNGKTLSKFSNVHTFQDKAKEALKVLEFGEQGELQFQQQVEKFKEEYKKAQSIRDSVLRSKVTRQIKEEQDKLLKKIDFGLKQKFIENKRGNYGIEHESDLVQAIRQNLMSSMNKDKVGSSSRKVRPMRTEVDKKTLIALKIQKSIKEKQEIKQQLNKQSGGFMTMLINKHKLEKIMQKAREQMVINELNIRAEKFCFFKLALVIVLSVWFQFITVVCIIGNIIVLSLDRYPNDRRLEVYLEYLNLAFFTFFAIEMFLKLVGLGFRYYFREPFNGFDCFIVIISAVDISLSYSHTNTRSGSGAITALRTFRLLRVFKLAKTWKQFQNLLATIGNTLKDISNFSVLLFLFILTYTLLGMELYSFKVRFNPITLALDLSANGQFPDSTFNSFLEAFVSVFIVLANDGWTNVYFNHYRATNAASSSIFFISLVILGQYILLNLFISILIMNFEQTQINQEARMKVRDISNVARLQKYLKRLRYKFVHKCQQLCCCCSRQVIPIDDMEKITQQIQAESIKQLEKKRQKKSIKEWQETQIKIKEGSIKSSTIKEDDISELNKMVALGSVIAEEMSDDEFEQPTQDEEQKLKSLFCLSSQNKVRMFCLRVVSHTYFEYFILFIIVVSCVQLSLDNPLNDPDSKLDEVITMIDYICSGVFAIEGLMKMVAFGCILNGSNSYLRNPWNILDFFIIVLTLISYMLGKFGFKVIKVFRVLRVLRPLRVISRNEGLKLSINSLFVSMTALLNVVVIAFVFLLIFGVIGVNYFKGGFYYCYTQHLSLQQSYNLIKNVDTKWDCYSIGGEWINYIQDYDDVGSSMSTLFQASTSIGWAKLMYKGAATRGINLQPKHLYNQYATFYFVIFIIVGNFFMLNLFIGVIISTYNKGKETYGKNFLLTEKQKRWLEAKLMIIQAKPIVRMKIPASEWRHPFFYLAQNKWFDQFIYLCIILNTVVLAIAWYGEPQNVASTTATMNYVFAAVFTAEAIVKIIGYGYRYFKDGWNIFDLLIVIITIVGIVLAITINVQLGPQTTIIRSFRIGRIFKLFRKNKSLKIIFQTFMVTLPAMFNIGSLLLLFIFCFSILGMYLFADVKWGDINNAISVDSNFSTLANSFLTLIRVSTGGNFHELMYSYGLQHVLLYQCHYSPTYDDYKNNNYKTLGCGNFYGSYIFFTAFVLFINLIYLKLFIAIILQGFQDTAEKDSRFFNSETSEYFREAWARFDPDGTSFIRIIDYPRLLLALGEPLGWDLTYLNNFEKQEQYLANVSIPQRNKGKNYQFMDVLENLALLMIVNKEIEDYVKKFEHQKQSIEKMKELINKEMKEGEMQVEFNQLHPGLPPPPPSAANRKNTDPLNIQIPKPDDPQIQCALATGSSKQSGTAFGGDHVKRRLRKKVKKYLKVKVKRRAQYMILDEDQQKEHGKWEEEQIEWKKKWEEQEKLLSNERKRVQEEKLIKEFEEEMKENRRSKSTIKDTNIRLDFQEYDDEEEKVEEEGLLYNQGKKKGQRKTAGLEQFIQVKNSATNKPSTTSSNKHFDFNLSESQKKSKAKSLKSKDSFLTEGLKGKGGTGTDGTGTKQDYEEDFEERQYQELEEELANMDNQNQQKALENMNKVKVCRY